MRIYTRTALLVLAVLLLTAIPVFASGAAAAGGAQGGIVQQATDKMTTLTVMQYYLSNQQTNFPDMWFYRELERETGVHVIWDVVRDADWVTTVNLRFASLNLPDVFRTGTVDVEDYGVGQGLLVPIDNYDLRTNMPNYYARLQMNESGKPMYSSDGHMYYVGYLEAQNINHIGNTYINKPWLDQLGLQVPTTVDQLTAVLRAFRDRAVGGANTLPMSAGGDEGYFTDRTQGIGPHFAMWGVPFHENKGIGQGSYAAVNAQGRVQFVTEYPGFREAVEWFAMAYSENLLDRESLTQDSNGWAVKVNAGRVGFFSYLRMYNSALQNNPQDTYVSIIPPAAAGRQVQVPRLMEVATQYRGASLTSHNKYITQTLQWLDKQLESERMFVSLYGNLNANGPFDPPPLTRLPNGVYSGVYTPANNALYSGVPVMHGLFFAPGDYIFANWDFSSLPHRVERAATSKAYADAGVMEPGSFTILSELISPYIPNADSTEMSRLLADINRLMQESLASFIRNGVTTASWNTFTSQINSVGVPRYVQLLQQSYDRYAASLR